MIYNDNEILSNNLIDNDHRQYFKTNCLCNNIFPTYTRCPMCPSFDRKHCSMLINDGCCLCDDMKPSDWLDFCDEISDEELAALAGVPVEKLRRDSEELEKYLGLAK